TPWSIRESTSARGMPDEQTFSAGPTTARPLSQESPRLVVTVAVLRSFPADAGWRVDRQ
nr:hypothetical protein [Tanacetum cinerariifolium]